MFRPMFRPMFFEIFFMLRTSGAQNIAKKRYMMYTFRLGLVGTLYPSELEQPVICGLVLVNPIFSAFL